MQNRTLIIAGMHRSGTSLITHWLKECGLHLGEDFLGAGLGNMDGHYEDIEFLRLHEEILTANNLPSTGFIEDSDINISDYHKEKLKSIIKVKNKRHDQWGWKDPRTCLFLDTYKELLPDARYLIIVRDYKEVVSSLMYREFQDFEKKYLSRDYFSRLVWKYFRRKKRMKKFYNERADHYLKVWIAYNEEILKNVETLPKHAYVVLNYESLNKNDVGVCSFLNQRWNMSLKYFKFKEVYKEKMISKHVDTDSYVNNKSLLKQANHLQRSLNNYLVMM
jgi:hypothetical protein